MEDIHENLGMEAKLKSKAGYLEGGRCLAKYSHSFENKYVEKITN